MNKGLRVNGLISSTDTIRTSGILRTTELQLTGASPMIYWATYGMNIDGGIDALTYNANAHTINTEAGTDLLYVDSAGGVTTYLPGYSNNGRGLLKTKVIQSTLGGTTPGNFLNIAHGISAMNKIIGFDAAVWEDSMGKWLHPGHLIATANAPGASFEINATNASWFIPGAAGNLKNAGDTVRWTIRYLE